MADEDNGTILNNGTQAYFGANRWNNRQNATGEVLSGSLFGVDLGLRNTRNGTAIAVDGGGFNAILGQDRTYVNAGGRPFIRSDATGSSINAGGVYVGGANGQSYGYGGQQGNYPRGGSATMSGYGSQTLDTSGWNGYDLNIVTDRAINREDPAQSVLAVLEAQSNSNLYGGSQLPGRDYLPGANIPGFQRVDRNGRVDLPSEKQLQSYLGDQLEDLMDQHPQAQSRAEAVALANEIRLQFGDDFAQGVADKMGRDALAELRDTTPLTPANSISAPRQTAAGQQNAPQIDPAAQQRLTARAAQLSNLDGTDPAQQAAVMRAALGEVGGVGLTNDQITQMQANLAVVADPNAAAQDKATATAQLASLQPNLEAVAADLNRVDPATREAFLNELSQDNPDLATQLETMAAGQTTTRNRESNMLTTEQLESVRFSDTNTQARYDAAVRAYDDIAAMPMIGPILNMFMESFGMGPHSIIRENADQVVNISQEALERIGPENNPVRAAIADNNPLTHYTKEQLGQNGVVAGQPMPQQPATPQEQPAVRTEAAMADVEDITIAEELNSLNAEQEAALATSLGLEGKDERQLTEAATLVASSIDGMTASDVADGISETELAKIQEVMGSDLGQAIQAALSGDGVTFDGVAETAEMQSVGSAAREAAAGRGA